jgi:hypothetical protein
MAATYRLVFDAAGNPTRIKDDYAASAAPDSGDTFAAGGWAKGSWWWVPTTNTLYICEDPAVATWTVVGSVGSDLTSLHEDLSVSGAHTADRADGATHDLTLVGNATITLDGAVTGEATDWRLIVRQDGTGSRTITWADTITWVGGSAPTLQTAANAVDTIGLVTIDDGTTYFGYHAGAGGGAGTPATTVESETTFGISPAVGSDTEYARQDHTHGSPADPVTEAAVQAVGRWEPVTHDYGSGQELVFDGDDILVHFIATP